MSQANKQASEDQGGSQLPGLRADAEDPPYVRHRQYVRGAGGSDRSSMSQRVRCKLIAEHTSRAATHSGGRVQAGGRQPRADYQSMLAV